MEILGLIFCGLGLFFIGFRMLSRNLRQLTGSRFRYLLQQATRSRLLSSAIGFLSGVITQSAVTSVFITTGFHTAGLLTTRRSVTVINWANIGTSVLMFIVIFNMKLLVFYFIGLIGLAYFLQLDKTRRLHLLFQFLFGLALLFMGIQFIKDSAGPLQSLPWFRSALQMSSGSIILLFFAGIILTIAAQSGPTVSVVALSLTTAGILTMPQTVAVLLGTGIGSAVNIVMLSLKLKGSGKQLCLYQSLFKMTGVITVAVLFVLDGLWSGSRQPFLLTLLPANPGHQAALVFLIMQVLPAILLGVFRKPVTALLARLSPPVAEDRLYWLEFLSEPALDDPETALYLAGKEQLRLMHLLPGFLTPFSPDRHHLTLQNIESLHEGFTNAHHQILQYLERLMKKPAAAGIQEKILNVMHFSDLLHDLETDLDEFVTAIHRSFDVIVDHPLTVRLTESLRTILDTSIESFESADTADVEIVLSITADKGELLQHIRQDFLSENAAMAVTERQTIYTLTVLFERLCWLLRSMTVARHRR
jgi:phosphate:Na+ symporter